MPRLLALLLVTVPFVSSFHPSIPRSWLSDSAYSTSPYACAMGKKPWRTLDLPRRVGDGALLLNCKGEGNEGGVEETPGSSNAEETEISAAKVKASSLKVGAGSPTEVAGSVDAITYVFGKPGEFDRDLKMMGTSRRRFVTLNLFALFFAFFANFAGVCGVPFKP